MDRIFITYVSGEPYPYMVEVWKNEGLWSSVYYDTLKEALRRARELGKQYGLEVWCFDGTIYDKNWVKYPTN